MTKALIADHAHHGTASHDGQKTAPPPGHRPPFPPQPPFRPIHSPGKPSPDHAATAWFIALAIIAAVGSFMSSMVAGAIASDVCRVGCDLAINVAIIGVMWGGIALATMVGIVGSRRAKRREQPRWKWPFMALLIIVVSAVARLLILNSLTGTGSY